MVTGLVHFLGGLISYHGLLAGNLIVAMAVISRERSLRDSISSILLQYETYPSGNA
jgi:hypothetical protein